jgi:hypothetical protein
MTPLAEPARYKHHRFPGEIISHGVWLYYRFDLSYRDVEEMMLALQPLTPENLRERLWPKTRGLPPPMCAILSPGNARVACHRFPGGFVSPMRAALSARVSTHDQHTLAMQMDTLRARATERH